MSIYTVVLIAFLISLFIGTHKVTVGLGIVLGFLTFCRWLDEMGWLD